MPNPGVIMPRTKKTTKVTKKKTRSTAKSVAVKKTQRSGGLKLSTRLRRESEGSIALLNTSALQLSAYAETFDCKNPTDEDLKQITKTLDAIRCTLKTKLDYLKFAKTFDK